MKKKMLFALAIIMLSGCNVNDADMVSKNVSTAAANFEVQRRIVFYNVRSGDYMLSIEGLCARENKGQEVEITCKDGPDSYKKHFLGLTTDVTYFIEQVEPVKSSKYFYRVVLKPTSILPNIEVR